MTIKNTYPKEPWVPDVLFMSNRRNKELALYCRCLLSNTDKTYFTKSLHIHSAQNDARITGRCSSNKRSHTSYNVVT